jgi:type I restriction enzyme, S subunit
MMTKFRIAHFGEFLIERKEFSLIDEMTLYKRARVQLHGRGIVLRDEVNGSEIKTKKQQVARAGEFLVAEIDAKVGGFGVVPPEIDGAIVSSHYFLFEINEMICLREWLNWYIRSGLLENQVNAQGSTNYASIRANHVLNYEIPLPSLEEQRHIISIIVSLSKPIYEANQIRKSTQNAVDSLLSSYLNKVLSPQKHSTITMGDVTNLVKRRVDEIKTSTVKSLGVKWWGKGAYVAEEKNVSELRADRFEVKSQDVIYNDMWARHGSVAIVPDTLDGHLASAHFPTWELDQSRIYPPFFTWCFRSPWFWRACEDNAQGSTGRNSITKPSFRSIVMPVPPLDDQRRIVVYLDSVQARLASLRELQSATGEELDALLPSVLDRAFKGEL